MDFRRQMTRRLGKTQREYSGKTLPWRRSMRGWKRCSLRIRKICGLSGGNFEEHLKPFTKGAFALDGKTEKASAVMPYYTISYDMDQKYKENVGNSYNKYLIQDLLGKSWDTKVWYVRTGA